MKNLSRNRKILIFRAIAPIIIAALLGNTIILPTPARAQSVLDLPAPGTMITVSPPYNPAIIKGITLHPENPLKFDFIVDPGDDNLQGEALRDEANKLIKYFMASLTVPEDEMWVNLSPYEKNRIIADGLSQTELGRDLLSQDYILKQLTATLMYPEEELGENFWDRIYAMAADRYGISEIPVNTFNKVWIVPEKADVYVTGNNVFVVDHYLKVMLEEDYLALESNLDHDRHGVGEVPEDQVKRINDVSSEVVREVIIPAIEREVNEGKNFANLRQMFHSMILATWYKQNLRKSLLSKVYANQNKVRGINLDDKFVKDKIYQAYVEAFEQGVFNFIKEDYDESTQQMIPRKYFSGGIAGGELGNVVSDNAALAKSSDFFSGSSPIGLEKTVRYEVVFTGMKDGQQLSPLGENQVDSAVLGGQAEISSPVSFSDDDIDVALEQINLIHLFKGNLHVSPNRRIAIDDELGKVVNLITGQIFEFDITQGLDHRGLPEIDVRHVIFSEDGRSITLKGAQFTTGQRIQKIDLISGKHTKWGLSGYSGDSLGPREDFETGIHVLDEQSLHIPIETASLADIPRQYHDPLRSWGLSPVGKWLTDGKTVLIHMKDFINNPIITTLFDRWDQQSFYFLKKIHTLQQKGFITSHH